jgi:hypothetical protein
MRPKGLSDCPAMSKHTSVSQHGMMVHASNPSESLRLRKGVEGRRQRQQITSPDADTKTDSALDMWRENNAGPTHLAGRSKVRLTVFLCSVVLFLTMGGTPAPAPPPGAFSLVQIWGESSKPLLPRVGGGAGRTRSHSGGGVGCSTVATGIAVATGIVIATGTASHVIVMVNELN